MKGIPVVIFRTGGMPLQIEHGKTGFVVDVGRTDLVAQHLYDLLIDDNLYASMKLAALTHDHEGKCSTAFALLSVCT